MTPEAVLSHFQCVRESGYGRYLARCPAHQDKSPSLSIRVTADQRILMHCFAGCHIEEIVSAVGLNVSDLFSGRPTTQTPTKSSQYKLSPTEALILFGHESFVVAFLTEELARLMGAGDAPSELALSRLRTAVARIQAVRSYTEEVTPPEVKEIRRGFAT